MQKKFQQVEIGLASPKQIREWAERELPNGELVGEVTSWETVNYKTLKPEPNGLFCQRIFGPVIDYSCACVKPKFDIGFCSKCGVEKTTSRVRRYRLGYIKFKQPIVHTLYASHKPSPFSLSLDWSNKRIQAIMYGTEFCKLPPHFTNFLSRVFIDRVLFEKKTRINKQKLTVHRNSSFVYKSKLNSNLNFSINQSSIRKKLDYFEHSKISSKYQKPKLFRSLNKISDAFNLDFYLFLQSKKRTENKNGTIRRKLETEYLLYGVTYDATWQQVESIQKFLLYLSEQAKSYEFSIPYYYFRKIVKNHTRKEIPIHKQFYPIQTGGFVFQKIFSHFNLVPILQQWRLNLRLVKTNIIFLQDKLKWYPSGGDSELFKERMRIVKKLTRLKQYEKKSVKRLQYFRDFYNTNMKPAWMILSYLPVLPPSLRPIMSIQGELIVSDINSLYRKVLTRNKRVNCVTLFKIFDTALSGSWESWCYNLRQVQEAVDSLFKTGNVESGKTTKSLLDSLKGKKGRFRQHLLGKRVDYSGRSVIVVGPNLKIYECGLPKQMAIELFQPFLIQKLRNKRIALTTTAAKTIISEKKPIIWSLLAQIMKNHPVLLNRAPTLHRLGIQAFLPRLVEGKAILLHPLVCPAFNADFDGDQMAVHIPLGTASRSEAFHLMWSRNQILAPASGQPLLLPTQDMVLGCYYLTIFKNSKLKDYKTNFVKLVKTENLSPSGFYFSTLNQVQQSYDKGIIETHTPIWLRWFGITQNFITEQESKSLEQPIEFRIDMYGKSEYIFNDRQLQKLKTFSDCFYILNHSKNSVYIRTTAGRIFFHKNFPL
jgi:DNA-directed RNA polymerase subunit beta'